MRHLPRAGRYYVAGVIFAGAVAFVDCLPHATFEQPLLFIMLLLLSSIVAAIKVPLPMTATGGSTMSVSSAVIFASLLLVGPHEAMLVGTASAFIQCHFKRKEVNPAYRTLFSVASLILTIQATSLVFGLLGGTRPPVPLSEVAGSLVGAATIYYLLNTGLIAGAIALCNGQKLGPTWCSNFLWTAPSYLAGAGVAALASSFVARTGYYWMAPFTCAPLYLMYRSYQMYVGRVEDEQRYVEQTSKLHLATIESLARAIDAKDSTTQLHIRRVQTYAAGLARAAGLSEPEIQGVQTAALLHDIGKLAVPEHILSKPGPLTHEEFQKIRIHPQVGAEIISGVPFPYPVAPLILSHHERWDGKGYPRGLKGDEIPRGARILTIVDYFDAVTTDRPYHRAVDTDSAVALLRYEVGRALDPQLVPLFIDLLPSLVEQFASEEPIAPQAEAGHARVGSGASLPLPAGDAFENIALAHREIYALYEIAQSMGTNLGLADTMALVCSKLVKLIPSSGCALFLHSPDTNALKCRYASGGDAARLLNVTLESGAGLAGWVAEHRRSIVNGDPRATFEAAGMSAATPLKAAIVCPLNFNDALIGCVALFHDEKDRYTDHHRRLVERIAEQAGPLIHNAIVFEQTQESSLIDPLTGLPSSRSMFVYTSRELARAERLKTQVALIVLDVDDFKTINDTYGHSVGDHALRQVAEELRGGVRAYDLCVRSAGDEFILVLEDCAREAADAKCLELQARIEGIEIDVRTGRRLRLAASAGAAIFPQDGVTYEQLLADADQRMTRDKAARRGRVPGAIPPRRRPLPEQVPVGRLTV